MEGITRYRLIAQDLRRRIRQGEWKNGDRLPSLDELMVEFDAGRITVRKALALLADEGLVVRHRDRRGTTVHHEQLDRRWFTLSLDFSELGRHAADVTAHLLSAEPWQGRLPVRPYEGRLSEHFTRLRHLHRHPHFASAIAVTDILLHDELYERAGPENFRTSPVLDVIALSGADIDRVSQTLTVDEADPENARLLRIQPSAPIVELRRIINDSDGYIIYVGRLVFRGDHIKLDFTLQR